MDMIDHYVNAVIDYLPKNKREFASSEIRANIEGLLPKNPSEEDVRKVLENLGSPMKYAEKYGGVKRYLIGPELYDNYIAVLKLVLGIVTTVLICITFIGWAFNPPINVELAQIPAKFITDLFEAVWEGILQAALWVTVVFVILERSKIDHGEIPSMHKKWSPDDLVDRPVSRKRKISRVETVFSMFFTVLFTAIICFQPQIIAMYVKYGNGTTQITQLFMFDRLRLYVPIIIILAVIQLGIFIWKYISMKWTIPLAIAQTVYNAAFCMLIIIMLNDRSLFNPEFIIKVADYAKTSTSEITAIWDKVTRAIAVVLVAGCSIDSISSFFKCRR